MSLFAELKRRNVFRVGLFYLVAAWLIVQIAETVLPIFEVPDAVIRGLILVLVIGFVPALVFAWAFELTPDGLKRDSAARVDPETKQQSAQKLNWATLVAAVLAIGLLAADRFLIQPQSSIMTADSASDAGSAAATTPVQSASSAIAVLPFVNMSPDPDNAYFADGISEELLNILAGIDGLTVASRTSAFSFRNSERPIPEIADVLGVRYVLEGSVRKQGDRVRITAQLIDADNDAHMWSDTYDRRLDDIFALQEEIAGSITGALTDRLGIGSVTVAAPTRNLEAYELFLRGRSLFHQRVSLDDAIEALRRAVDMDPGFAEAWAFLAAAEHVSASGGYPITFDLAELTSAYEASVERALALDSSIPIAQAIRGQLLIARRNRDDLEAGLRLLADAASTVSADTTAKMWLGMNYYELGYVDTATEHLQRAVDLDPLVAINHGYLGVARTAQGSRETGAEHAYRALELSGELTYWLTLVAIDASNAGDRNQAVAYLQDCAQALASTGISGWFPDIERVLLDEIGYREWVARHPDSANAFNDTYRMMLALIVRDYDAALDLFASSDTNGRNVLMQTAWFPALEGLREDPRFFEAAKARGYVDYWEAHGFPLDCRRIEIDGLSRLECGDDV